jgi:hypothetical protein
VECGGGGGGGGGGERRRLLENSMVSVLWVGTGSFPVVKYLNKVITTADCLRPPELRQKGSAMCV